MYKNIWTERNGLEPDRVTYRFFAWDNNFHNTVHDGFLFAEVKPCHAG